MNEKINTKILPPKRKAKSKKTKGSLKLSSFFKYLYDGEIDRLYKNDDLHSHLILNFDFKNKLRFNNLQTGSIVKGTTEELYNALKNDDFRGIVLKKKFFSILEKHNKEKTSIFNFNNYLSEMLEIRSFSLSSAEDVWNLQGSKESVIKGILRTKKKNDKNYGNFNRVVPSEGYDIKSPKLNYYITGTNFPVVVQKTPKELSIKEISNKNNDNGVVIIDENNQLIDIIKINDFWIYDYPLATRLDFLGRFGKTNPYLICETIDEIIKAGKNLNANRTDGLLIRSILESCVPGKCNWLVWSAKSIVTFQNWRERNGASRILRLIDSNIWEYDINLDDIRYDYIDITLDGSEYSIGFEHNWFMSKDDFDVWSKILKFKKNKE